MADKIWELVKIYCGKHCEVDGGPQNQCVDLVKAWYQMLGITKFTGSASDYGPNFHPEAFTWYKNWPWSVPPRGAVMVEKYGGTAHVSINLEANKWTYDCFEQNVPIGNVCRVQRKNYLNPRVVGWLVPKVLEQ